MVQPEAFLVSDTLLYILIGLAALIVLFVLFRLFGSSSGEASSGTAAGMPAADSAAPAKRAEPALPPAVEPVPAPATVPPAPVSSETGEELTQIKGLGPKAAKGLAEMGVTRFDQIAAWSAGDIEAAGAKLGGSFADRIARDRWVEQAGLLARDEIAAFEEKFGKLG
jgi:predicted flap endonuclease-1-like 5' DNA nuclease